MAVFFGKNAFLYRFRCYENSTSAGLGFITVLRPFQTASGKTDVFLYGYAFSCKNYFNAEYPDNIKRIKLSASVYSASVYKSAVFTEVIQSKNALMTVYFCMSPAYVIAL